MRLPVMPPVSPMLAKAVREIPPDASYEPKWDGFRSICFRDDDDVELGSRNERPMTRYFPEVVAAVRAELPTRCVIDGEIIIATPDGLDFEALQLRLHPAESRVRMLSEKTPAAFIAFCVQTVNSSLDNPTFDIHFNARTAGQDLVSKNKISYAMVITVSCGKVPDLYDRVLRTYATQLQALQPAINIPITT